MGLNGLGVRDTRILVEAMALEYPQNDGAVVVTPEGTMLGSASYPTE